MYYEQNEIDYYENEIKKINNIIDKKKMIMCDITELKVGQYVFVEFFPFSQKYIYTLLPKLGKISIVPKHNNIFDYKIINYENVSESLFHPSVSYYGNTLGYQYYIYLIEK